MEKKYCPPGSGRPCPPTFMRSQFASLPGRMGGTPSGGMNPFTNSAPSSSPPAPAPSPGPTPGPAAWSAEFSGVIDAFISQMFAIPNFPFSLFGPPFRVDMTYVLNPPDFRTNNGGFGGFGVQVSVPSKNIGWEFQASSPSNFYITTYNNFVPIDPDNVMAQRQDYLPAVWPVGNPTIMITFDAAMVPHLFFDGVETPLIAGDPPYDQPLVSGNYANVYAYAGLAGLTVDVTNLTIAST